MSDDPSMPGPEIGDSERQYATVLHLSALTTYLGIPLANIVAPLLLWQLRRESAFVDAHGREAVNFQLSFTIYALALIALTIGTLGIGILLTAPALVLLAGVHIVLNVLAAVAANGGRTYTFPLTIRFIKPDRP